MKDWSKAEDYILKGGIQKYGLNKWGKVASLLYRTPLECKFRYNSFLKNKLSNVKNYNNDKIISKDANNDKIISKELILKILRLCPLFDYCTVGKMLKIAPIQCQQIFEAVCLDTSIPIETQPKRLEDQIKIDMANKRFYPK